MSSWGLAGDGADQRDVGVELDAETGRVGQFQPPVDRYRLAEQQRLEHRHHFVGLRSHHQELGERAVGPGDDEVVGVHARPVGHDQRTVSVSEGGDLDQFGDAAAPADVGLNDVGTAHLQQHPEPVPG